MAEVHSGRRRVVVRRHQLGAPRAGYVNEEEAAQERGRWRDVITRTFARVHPDFGDRRPFGTLTKDGEAWFSEQVGHPVLGDRPGVQVFVDQPGLRFVASNAEGCKRPSEERNRLVLTDAARLNEPLKGPERLAFDLYSGSFFQPSADSRLLMLTMAVETLLDLQPRSDAARAHVTAMMEATEGAGRLSSKEVGRSRIVRCMRPAREHRPNRGHLRPGLGDRSPAMILPKVRDRRFVTDPPLARSR